MATLNFKLQIAADFKAVLLFSTSSTVPTAFKFKIQQHIMRLCEYVRRKCNSNAVQIGSNVFVITVKFGCTNIWALIKLCYICCIGLRLQRRQQTAEVIKFHNTNVKLTVPVLYMFRFTILLDISN